MGLRDYLASLQSGLQGAQAGSEAAAAIRQQAQLQDLSAQAPELLNQGKFNDVAAMAAGAGDMSLLRQLASNQQEAQLKPKSVPFTEAQLIAQGVPADKAKLFSQIPDLATQDKAVSNFESSRSAGLTGQGLSLQAQAQSRLAEESVQKQRASSGKIIGDWEKNDVEEKRAIEKVNAALKSNSLTGDAIVVNYIARAMAGEKGPLAEGDITRLIGTSFEGDVARAQNYLQSIAQPTSSPEQRRVYKQLLELAQSNYSTWRGNSAGKAFSQAIENNPKLAKDGKLDPSLKNKAKRLGIEVDLDPDTGAPVVNIGTKSAPQNPVNPETGAPDITILEQQIELIQDPNVKAKAKAKIQDAKKKAASGNPLNADALNAFATQIKTFLPK
jgi:hypothetical protein